MKIKNEIWILADDRPGTFSQSIGLAEELGLEYKIITLTYSFFSLLPNCFLNNSLLRISSDLRKKISNSDYLPSIVISAGRRSAPIALHLKNQSENQSKIIQIMNPNLDFKKFDFVILPKHDEAKEAPNLISTLGSLTKINDEIIADAGAKFSEKFQDLRKIKIALLVGGASKKTKFEKSDAINLAKTSARIAKNMDATLLVLTSRRTGSELTAAIESNLSCDFKMFDWEKLGAENPYLGIVGFADFFITTGDSVSMISECASTGKPVYIFDAENISTAKHRRFHQNLFDENYAKKFSDDLQSLENFSQKKLQETKRVASIIKGGLK